MSDLRILDLFSGIGGFSLGLERSSPRFRTVAFCECDDYAVRVLRRRWEGVPCYPDVRELTADRLAGDGIQPTVVTAGFPCQDISTSGRGAGIDGERSGLWREVARLVGELRPRYVLLENVSALLDRGLGRVLGDLAQIGYDCEWHCMGAAHIGAPHFRDRWFAVAYPRGFHAQTDQPAHGLPPTPRFDWKTAWAAWSRSSPRREWWRVEPGLDRVANGVRNRVDRLRCLGNAIVPQIPEIIGAAITASDEASE